MAAISAIRCRCGRYAFMPPACRAFWSRIAGIPFSTTAAISAIRCRCGRYAFMFPACSAFWSCIAGIPLSTTAAISAIQCRCGRYAFMFPACRAFWGRIAGISLSTTAAISAIRCRCGKQVCSSPFREKMRDKQADRTSENAIRKGADRGLPNGSSIVSRMYCRIIKGLRFALFAGPPAFCRKTGILPVVQQMAFFGCSDYQVFLET